MFQSMKEKLQRKASQAAAVLSGGAVLIANANAAAPATVSDLTTGIDFSSISLGVLAVAAAVIVYTIVLKSAKTVVHAVRSF